LKILKDFFPKDTNFDNIMEDEIAKVEFCLTTDAENA
jgi:IS30 family transposase